jgi:hypothetical protein
MMKDDYLWDGSGDIDPEIERLENLLGRYRHTGTAPQMPVTMLASSRRFNWTRLAVAAALVLTLAGALLFALNYGASDEGKEIIADQNNQPAPDSQDLLYRQPPLVAPQAVEPKRAIVAAKPAPRPVERKTRKAAPVADDPWQFSSTATMADLETARYLEQAEVLLRSFRNVSETGESIDVSLEKEQSRDLLYKNILLRRTAEAKGNLPVSDLLGSLEPILIDIANLPESPTRQEVQLIKDFIRQKEMVATIQVYSSPAISVDAR